MKRRVKELVLEVRAKKQVGNDPGLGTWVIPIASVHFLHMGQKACEGVGEPGV